MVIPYIKRGDERIKSSIIDSKVKLCRIRLCGGVVVQMKMDIEVPAGVIR